MSVNTGGADQVEIERLTAKVGELEAFLFKRSHMCNGRDCVGVLQEPTGSLLRCKDCTELAALKEKES